MSYYATGSGTIELRCAAKDVPCDVMAALKEEFNASYYYDNRLDLYSDGNYHEANVYDALEKISSYTKSGRIEFSGEEGDIWAITFNEDSKEWDEEQATIFWFLSDLGVTDEEIAFLKRAVEQAEGTQEIKDSLLKKLGIAVG